MYKRRVTVIAADVDDSVSCSLPPLFLRAGAIPVGLVPCRRRDPPSQKRTRTYIVHTVGPLFPRTHKNVCCSKDHCVKITSLRAHRITSSRGKNMYIAHINMYTPRPPFSPGSREFANGRACTQKIKTHAYQEAKRGE